MSKWWHEVHHILDIKLLMSTSSHPQMDGITERVNCSIAQILCGFISSNQRDWVKLLPLVEFTINSTINRAMGMAPFEICNGLLPWMMQDLPLAECIPPEVCTFTMNSLHNMAVAHDCIITEQVFQQYYTNKHRHNEPDVKQGDLI
jgi:hypothetical protein